MSDNNGRTSNAPVELACGQAAAQEANVASCPLLELSDDMLAVIGQQISDALWPAVACALAASNHNLWRLMRAPLATLQPRHAAARALAAKVGWSCAEMREATGLLWDDKGLTAPDMATLTMLFSMGSLPMVKVLFLIDNSFGGSAWIDELCCGAAPRVTVVSLYGSGLGAEGATVLAAALDRGAVPTLEILRIGRNRLGDAGLAALAAPLRRRPALKQLSLVDNGIGDAGMVSLVERLGPREFKHLEVLQLQINKIGDAGCALLSTALDGAALPALGLARGSSSTHCNPASEAAQTAVCNAMRANVARRTCVNNTCPGILKWSVE